MESSLKIFEYQGSQVTFDTGNGTFVNATDMARPFGKRVNDFTTLKGTKKFINALKSVRTGITVVEIRNGGSNPGTWMHEDLAMEFARWLDPRFAIWCNDRIKELLTNGVVRTGAPIPDFKDPVIAARAWADEREAKQLALAEAEHSQKKLDISEDKRKMLQLFHDREWDKIDRDDLYKRKS